MIHVGDIMSTVGVFSTVEYSNNKRFSPYDTEHPHGTHDIPHGTELSPTVFKITPTVLMIAPTVLNTPTVLKIFPHIYHDIPHGTEHPHGTQDIPPWYS